MLNSLHIVNYRCLENLTINDVGQVNLIIGRNNTGKSSLLEAIGIYATDGEIAFITQLLDDRGEKPKRLSRRTPSDENVFESTIRPLSSLFTGRQYTVPAHVAIEIGNKKSDASLNEPRITLSIVPFVEEDLFNQDEASTSKIKRKVEIAELKNGKECRMALEMVKGTDYFLRPLSPRSLYPPFLNSSSEFKNVQFVKTRNVDREANGKLFDDIILTEKELHVIEALKIVEAKTERIAFIEDVGGNRLAVIKLTDSNKVFPLRSMGDGISRILTIILALVNAENGYLLIDEFENGLHHSVQEKLWEIIFTLSQKLNIQVFATTHSEDCIAGFEEVLSSQSDKKAGKLIRLENRNGKIVEVEFTANELRIATENNIEIR